MFDQFDTGVKPPEPSGDTSKGFKRAFAQLPELAYGAGALASMSAENLFGEGGLSTAAKNYFGEKFAAKQAENQQYAPSVEFTDAWENLKSGDLGSMVDWLQDSAGYVAGQAIQTAVTGGIGAVVGKAGLSAATQKMLGGVVAKQAAKIAEETVSKQGLTAAAAELAIKSVLPEATKIAAQRTAQAIGAGIALQAQNLGMEAGDIYGGLIEESEKTGKPITGDDLLRAWGAAAVAAGTETATDLLGLGAVTGRLNIGKMTGLSGRAARGAAGAAVGLPIEAGQEYVQTGLEQYGAGKPTDTPEAERERINAAAVGGLGGTVVGGGAGLISSAQQQGQLEDHARNEERVTAEGLENIDAAQDANSAIQAATEATSQPVGPAVGANITVNDSELTGLIESEARDQKARFAEQQVERAKQAELDAIQAGTAPSTPQPQTAMAIAMQEARARARQQEQDRMAQEAAAQDQAVQDAAKAAEQARAPQPEDLPILQRLMKREPVSDTEGQAVLVKGFVAPRGDGTLKVIEKGLKARNFLLRQATKEQEQGQPAQQTPAIAPKTVAGVAVDQHSDAQLQTLATDAMAPANTRHAAAAALQARKQNPEDQSSQPVAESQALAPEASDTGVAPGQAATLPEQQEAAPAAQAEPAAPIQAEVERFQGQYGKGMNITPARVALKERAAKQPDLTWTIEKSTIPEFPDRFDVVGRKPAEAATAAQPAAPAQPTAGPEKAAPAPASQAEPAKAPPVRINGQLPAEMSVTALQLAAENAPYFDQKAAATAELKTRDRKGETIFGMTVDQLSDKQLAIAASKGKKGVKPLARAEIAKRTADAEQLAERIKEPGTAETLKSLADQAGWAERGGHMIRTKTGEAAGEEVISRTKWIPRAEWWPTRPVQENEGYYRAAVDKAIAGDKLTGKQAQVVRFLLDLAQYEGEDVPHETTQAEAEQAQDFVDSSEQATDSWSTMTEEQKEDELDSLFGKSTRPAAEGEKARAPAAQGEVGQAERPALDLARQTEDDLKAKAAKEEAAAKAKADAEKKAAADDQRGGFTLTGSDRPADVGAAAGQADIFAQPAKPAAEMSAADLLRAAAAKMDEAASGKMPAMAQDKSAAADQPTPAAAGESGVSADQLARIFDENRWLDRGLKIGTKTKLYRGEDQNTGRRVGGEGRGLYTTTDKDQAKGYGAIKEMSHGDLPKNPIRFRDVAFFGEWRRFVVRELGFERESEFEKAYSPHADVWIRQLDSSIDGVQIGTGHGAFFVKFPNEPSAGISSPVAPNRSETTTKPADLVGQMVKFKITAPSGETSAAGRVLSVRPDGKLDIRLQQGGYVQLAADEVTPFASITAEKEGGIADKNIQDFGERIAGARKDYAAKLAEAKSADIAAVPLSQSWPEPDYQKLFDGGSNAWAVAFMHAARDEVPTKPSQSWKLQRWVAMVEKLRDTSLELAAGNLSVERARELLAGNKGLNTVADRVDLYQEVGHAKSLRGIRISEGVYSMYDRVAYDPPKVIWSVEMKAANTAMSRWPKMIATGGTRAEAIAAFKKSWLETTPEQDATKAIDFQIYSKRGSKEIFIGKKIGSNVAELKGGFANAKEARAWKAENQAELLRLLEKYKDVPYERNETNSPRVGIDHRNGADVTPERFTEAFGFRGVQFGNYVEDAKRQQDLNEAYDALMDLAGVLGIPSKALSLNGELGLAFGARGTGGKHAPSAHYEPVQVVINLTKARGAGSLAHEWFHGVDNYFARMGGKPAGYLSESTTAGAPVRPEMVEAFKKIREAIRKTDLIKRSQRLDQTRSKPYWATGLEMAARSFESYIVAKLQDQNASNDYLANIVSEDYWKAATALGVEKDNTFPYPTADEMAVVRAAFDHFFQTIETRETDKGVALYSRTPKGAPVSTGITTPEIQALNDKMAEDLGDPKWRNAYALAQPGTARTNIAAAIKAAFGKDTVFIAHQIPEGSGFEGISYGGRIYVNIANEQHGFVNILGHELLHQIKEDYPEVYEWFAGEAANYYRPGATERYGRNLEKTGAENFDAQEELLADFTGDALADPEFLKVLANHDPSKFKQLLDAVVTWLKRVATKLYGKGFRSSEYFTDTNKLRGYLAGILDAYAEQNKPSAIDGAAPPRFSRATARGGIARRDLQAVIDTARRSFKNLPKIVIVDEKTDIPEGLAAAMEGVDAVENIEAALHDGVIYMFRWNTRSMARAEHTLLSHELRHYGLRGTLGPNLDPILRNLYLNNRALRQRADAIRKKFGLSSIAEATEEALVETPQAELVKLTGWRKFVLYVRDALRRLGLTRLADAIDARLDDQQDRLSSIEISRILNVAEEWVKNGRAPPKDWMEGTRFGDAMSRSGLLSKARLHAYATDHENRPLIQLGVMSLAEPEQWSKQGDVTNYEHVVVSKGDEVGIVSLGWRGDQAVQLHNIRTFSGGRENGYGTRILDTILTNNDPNTTLWIRHVTPEARQWWINRGAQIFRTEEGEDATLTKADFDAAHADQQTDRRTAGEASQARAETAVGEGENGSGDTGRQPGDETVARFSRTPTAPDWVKKQPTDTQEALRKAGVWHAPPTLKARVKEWSKDWQKRMKQGVVDQFDPIKEYDYHAYMLARMARGADNALDGLLNYGTVYLDNDGAVDVNFERGGFLGIMSKLAGEHDRFLAWVIGNRAGRLLAEGREHNFTAQDISRLKALNQGQMAGGASRAQEYARVRADLDRYNKAVLDIAEKSGLIDAAGRVAWEKDFYVPFYRLMEDEAGKQQGPIPSKGLVNQYAFKVLKGGEQALGDPMENVLKNWSHLLDASLNNQAARESLLAAQRVGAVVEGDEATVRQMAKAAGLKEAVVSFTDQGEQRWFMVEDPFLLDAMKAIGFTGFQGAGMKVMQKFKKWLTIGVTVSPTFRIRNVIRDSLQMIGANPASYNVLGNVLTGWKATKADSPEYASILVGGGVMRFGTILDGNRAEHVKRLIESGVDDQTILTTPQRVKDAMQQAWDWWQTVGDRAENVNRAALYKKLLADGKTHLEASFAARDTMDFSMQGTWAAVRFLSQTVPFFNARLQGLYKLSRGAAEDPRRFGIVVGGAALASIALLLAYRDDDEWQKREAWDRETYWAFRVGDTMFRIPKPFEIGAIATIAERGLEAMISDELTGKQFAERVFSIVSQQLSMNPVPQLAMPLIELYANRDSFTDRPIEGMGMERLSKPMRAGPYTSATAQLLGKNGLISPVQIDHLVSGYFGWLGSHIVSTADLALRPAMDLPGKPAYRVDDVLVAGDFAKNLPSYQSKYVTRLYDQMKEVQQAMADLRELQKVGAIEEAKELIEDKGDKIRLYWLYTNAQKQMTNVNRQIKMVPYRAGTAAEKRERLDALYKIKNRIAETTERSARSLQR